MLKPAHPTQKLKQTETWEGEGGALSGAPEVPQPLPFKPLDPLSPVSRIRNTQMKTYSDNAVTKADLNEIDKKQTKQILQLRIAVAVCFIVNALATLVLYIK